MKFLRVIRFDGSDEHVYAHAAPPDDWALPGGFAFAGIEDGDLKGKLRQAFANGFLGVPSFGRSTFATVAEMSENEYDGFIAALADHLIADYGAPDRDAALDAARAEAGFVMEMCAEKPVNTVFTVRRVLEAEGIREEFREITPPSEPAHSRIWDVMEDDA